jgi:hypothetical protein
VVTGPKGKRGFNFDADTVCLKASAVVGAVNNKPAGTHRFEASETLGDPIRGRDWLDAKRVCRRRAGREFDQSAQSWLVGSCAEMDRHLPATAVLEGGTGGFLGSEDFTEIRRNPAGGRFVAGEAGDDGGRIHLVQV